MWSDDTELAFTPLLPEFARSPYPFYAALRSRPGLTYFPDFDIWLASRYADVTTLVNDRSLVRSLDGFASPDELAAARRAGNWHDMPHHQRFVQFSLLDSDGPVHDRLRRLVFALFTPVMIDRLREQIAALVDSLLDRVMDRREIEFVGELASELPGHIIGRLLGVPDEDCPRLRVWSENIVQFFDIDRSDERKQRAETSTTEFYRYLLALKSERERRPREDLISSLIAAERSGALSEDETVSTCMLILMAGHGSTIDVLGTGLHSLLRAPDQMARLRGDAKTIRTAIPEMFRFESPLPFFHRHATQEIHLEGQTFAPGTKFGLLYASANRDPAQFDNPDSFDICRSPNRHLAFGGGAHFCLGNHLARLDMELFFTRLLQRFQKIELIDAEPPYKRGLSVRGPLRLPIALIPR